MSHDFLVHSWLLLLPRGIVQAVIALAAVLCGAAVGRERQRKEKPAGIRTMALVCLGAAVFTMVGFALAGSNGEAGRVAAQIVTGIGFLGGGVIRRETSQVKGTTTAATIWLVAAVGMVIGAGYVPAGMGLALLATSLLGALGVWEKSHYGGGRTETVTLRFRPDGGKTLIRIGKVLSDFDLTREEGDLALAQDGRGELQVRYRLPAHRHIDLLHELAGIPEVDEVQR